MKNRLEDKILLLQIKGGNQDAFSQLYRKYVDGIYRYIYFKTGVKSDAEEIASTVFLKCWSYIKEGNSISNVRPFLYRIARNMVVDYHRSKGKDKYVSLESVAESHASQTETIEENIDTKAELGVIKKALIYIKDDYREVIVLKYMEGLSTKEISEVVRKSSTATRVHIHRAMKQLKEVLKNNEKSS